MCPSCLSAVAIIALACPLGTSLDDVKVARETIEKGIEALGGAAKIEQFDRATWRSRGLYHGPGGNVQYSAVYYVQWPDRFRFEMEGRFTMVLNGASGWIIAANEIVDMTGDQLQEQLNTVYAGLVARLVVLKQPDYSIRAGAEIKVNDRPTVGVRVTHKDRPDITLYFDKETHLLVKRERRAKAIDLGGVEVTVEEFMRDYREIDGFKYPGKTETRRNGLVLVESENVDMTSVAKFPATLFGRP